MDTQESKPWPVEKIYKNESGYTITVYKAAYLLRCIRYATGAEEDDDTLGTQNL